MMDATTSTTLNEAIEWLMERIDEGTSCPCCGQRVQRYRRSINSGMARALISQWQHSGQREVHTKKLWLPYSKEAAQLQWWGLISQSDSRRDDGGQSGWWHITDRGRDFVQGQVSVPKYAFVFNKELLSLSGEEVTIRECLGDHFNYAELMGFSAARWSSHAG